ncbi:hypothetical protein KCU62_g1592, partial [Aureobasidium sp. EXF-3399]
MSITLRTSLNFDAAAIQDINPMGTHTDKGPTPSNNDPTPPTTTLSSSAKLTLGPSSRPTPRSRVLRSRVTKPSPLANSSTPPNTI